MVAPTARFIPRPRLHEVDRVAVAADPSTTWAAIRGFDLYRLRYLRTLFALRGAGGKTATLDAIVAPGQGFRRLAEDEGRSFVAGAVGRFWQRQIPFVQVAPEDFAAFDEPGFGKVAWSVEVHPRGDGGSWIVIDLRVDATSSEAWDAFIPYWLAIGRFSRSMRRHALRYFERTLGRALPDAKRSLPGDELIVKPRATVTDAITIEAPADEVWPSLVGMRDVWPRSGEGRFDVLDREPGRALVLGSRSLLGGVETETGYVVTWAFYLEPIGAEATRLIVRVRADFAPTVLSELARPFLFAVHSLMESAQLHRLKERVEAHGSRVASRERRSEVSHDDDASSPVRR